VDQHGSAATAMLGMTGFVLLAVSSNEGEFEQAIETTAVEDFCRGCGVAARLHDRRPTWVRDLPAAGRPVTLVWIKRVWRCVESKCAVSTWTETSELIRARSSWTERARAEACRRVGEDGHSVAQDRRGHQKPAVMRRVLGIDHLGTVLAVLPFHVRLLHGACTTMPLRQRKAPPGFEVGIS